MALRGYTQDFGLADALQLIVNGSKSGALRCVSQEETVVFGVDEAYITRVETEGRPTGARLGNRLVRASVLTRAELGRVLARRARTQEPVEALVVELGLTDTETVRHHVTLLAADALLETFLWTEGTYELIEGGAPEPSPWIVPISVEQLLMQGVPLVQDWPQIDETIPSANTRIASRRTIPQAAVTTELTTDLLFGSDSSPQSTSALDENERVVHELCEPGLDVQTVVDRSPFHRMETCRCLRTLVGNELVTLRPR